MTKKDFVLSRWIRSEICHNPTINFDQLLQNYKQQSLPVSQTPKDRQVFYSAKSHLKSHWGVETSEMPKNSDGSLNMSGMVRLYLDVAGINSTEKQARKFFAVDGIDLKGGIFSGAKAAYMKSSGASSEHVEVSAEVPRARFVGKSEGSYSKDFVGKLLQTNEYVKSMGGIDMVRKLLDCLEDVTSE